jgi:hypothetical protein
MPAVSFGNMQERQYSACMLLPLLPQIIGQQMRHSTQMERFEAKGFM